MPGGAPFIDRKYFYEILAQIPRGDGLQYEDRATIYRDMSRLVVALLASTSSEELRKLYHELGWQGGFNARPLHLAAEAWMAKHRSSERRD